MDKYTARSALAALAFFGPIIAYGICGTTLEAASTLSALIGGLYIVGAIFVVACIGTGIEWAIRYLFTNKGAG